MRTIGTGPDPAILLRLAVQAGQALFSFGNECIQIDDGVEYSSRSRTMNTPISLV